MREMVKFDGTGDKGYYFSKVLSGVLWCWLCVGGGAQSPYVFSSHSRYMTPIFRLFM